MASQKKLFVPPRPASFAPPPPAASRKVQVVIVSETGEELMTQEVAEDEFDKVCHVVEDAAGFLKPEVDA